MKYSLHRSIVEAVTFGAATASGLVSACTGDIGGALSMMALIIVLIYMKLTIVEMALSRLETIKLLYEGARHIQELQMQLHIANHRLKASERKVLSWEERQRLS